MNYYYKIGVTYKTRTKQSFHTKTKRLHIYGLEVHIHLKEGIKCIKKVSFSHIEQLLWLCPRNTGTLSLSISPMHSNNTQIHFVGKTCLASAFIAFCAVVTLYSLRVAPQCK